MEVLTAKQQSDHRITAIFIDPWASHVLLTVRAPFTATPLSRAARARPLRCRCSALQGPVRPTGGFTTCGALPRSEVRREVAQRSTTCTGGPGACSPGARPSQRRHYVHHRALQPRHPAHRPLSKPLDKLFYSHGRRWPRARVLSELKGPLGGWPLTAVGWSPANQVRAALLPAVAGLLRWLPSMHSLGRTRSCLQPQDSGCVHAETTSHSKHSPGSRGWAPPPRSAARNGVTHTHRNAA